jgi:serine/threonine protein kinase
MDQIEKEFIDFYSKQLLVSEKLPAFITDKFKIDSCLYSTEAKEIYITTDIQSGKKYILKQAPEKLSFQSKAERDILNSIIHPSFPKVHTWYEDESYTYLIREYFDGITLEALVARNGVLPDSEIKNICIQICDLLSYLHNHNPPIIHRDIKPQNVILKTDGSIGLIDFDTSRQYDQYATNDTVYMGTKQTAAPEQFGYGQTDQHTDIYSLGILLIYLATGSYDKSGLNSMPAWLKSIAATCTEFSPKDRYQTVVEVKKCMLKKSKPFFYRKPIAFICIFLLCAAIGCASFFAGKNTSSFTKESKHEITFECPRIEQAVRETLGKTSGEPISELELGQITRLNIIGDLPSSVSNEKIQHDYVGNRIKFDGKDVKRGKVDSVADLSKLPFLTSVTLIYQQIKDLSGIEKLQLQELFIGYNRVSDLSPLKDMHSLSNLSIVCNPVADLTPLEKLTRLKYIQISNTNVLDLNPLTSIHSLEQVDVTFTPNFDLSPLNKMKNLKKIYK